MRDSHGIRKALLEVLGRRDAWIRVADCPEVREFTF